MGVKTKLKGVKTVVAEAAGKVDQWPPLEPSDASGENPHFDILLDTQIISIKHLFSMKTCLSFLHYFKSLSLTPSPPPKKGEAARTNDRYSIYDPTFAARLYSETCLQKAIYDLSVTAARGSNLNPVGLNPNIRVYRYLPGTFFQKHYDDSVIDPNTKQKSYWTLLIYILEGTMIGGETAFCLPGSRTEIAPAVEQGMALLHRHGHECLLHEGREVKNGVKWVLRSDVMFA